MIKIEKLRKIARRYKRQLTPLTRLIGIKTIQGKQVFKDNYKTVIVVSHEASETGAPILALNLCTELNKKYNVIAILVRGGPLTNEFIKTSHVVLQARLGLASQASISRSINDICGASLPTFAIVNSIVSSGLIQPLRNHGIPVITSIHEFSAYIRPIGSLKNVGLWSSKLIFSSPLTKDDLLSDCKELKNISTHVLPQGQCKRPNSKARDISTSCNNDDAWQLAKNIGNEEILVLGAGEIQPRKGVDYFIAVCRKINLQCGNIKLRFAWIGSGFDPENDFNVSLWLNDQIKRSNLDGKLTIVNHSTAYDTLMQRADVFLITSRLDPLPNVGIDAMLLGKPTLCFEKACGLASLVKTNNYLKKYLIADYLDVDMMAQHVIQVIENPNLRRTISEVLQANAQNWFNMEKYIARLDELGKESAVEELQLNNDIDYLKSKRGLSGLKPKSGLKELNDAAVRHYCLSWRCNIDTIKPHPGFHPGIYRDQCMNTDKKEDPYVHFLKSGCPNGEWSYDVIKPSSELLSINKELRVGLHIHVHYPELLADILRRLRSNRCNPDLYISCNDSSIINTVEENVIRADCRIKSIELVPNRGRDIGPLLVKFGKILTREYDVHGHIHTKKSKQIGEKQGNQWRNFLYENLLGSPKHKMVDLIIKNFAENNDLGLIYPDDPNCVGWNDNYKEAIELSQKLGIKGLPKNFNFPVGTMFWARSGALDTLYDMPFNWYDFPDEPLAYDGTVLHAIERLLPIISNSNGFINKLTAIDGVNR